MGKYFGTDGARGLANIVLTPELAFQLGRAGAYVLTKECHHAPRILVAMDTRLSGDMLCAALTAGLCSVGAQVFQAGVIPTPAVAYLVRHYHMDAGVMISASHNSMEDNGIKYFDAYGYKLKDELEEIIEKCIEDGMTEVPRPSGAGVGHITECTTALEDYLSFIRGTVLDMYLSKRKKPLKVAVDCANGATFKAAPEIMRQLGMEVYPLHCMPDGKNINDKCGSTHMESLVEFVKENKMDVGFALDGDGDRMLCVDENGKMIEGDEIMSIAAAFLKEQGRLKDNTLVATVMSNLGLFIMGNEQNINIVKTTVGDRYVLEEMLKNGYVLGGEQSGHVIFLEHNTTGDGILTAVQLLYIMYSTGKTLSQLNTLMEVMPQVLINVVVKLENKNAYADNEQIKSAIDALERKYAQNGRVLIRASGTEPKVRVMIEGRNKAEIEADAQQLADLIKLLMA